MAGSEIEITTKIISYALVGGFLPALFWLWFWLKEDSDRPEPNLLIVKTFIFGGLSVVGAFILQKIFTEFIAFNNTLEFYIQNPDASLSFLINTAPFFLTWAFIEELVKLLAVAFALSTTKYLDEPIDAMIYMVTAAIGFAAVENSLFLMSVLGSGEENMLFILTGNLRFIGATLVHVVSSAIIGATLSLSFCKTLNRKIIALFGGLLLASLLHALFNLSIMMTTNSGVLQTFIVLWLMVVGIIVIFEQVKTITCTPSFKNRTPTSFNINK